MSKEMLINTVEGQECRIAVVEDGVLEELYVERASSASRVGNIYKGRVTNVEPAIQAAFIDFGVGKNGFLHISDINPQYFPRGGSRGPESVGRKRSHRDRPPIQECLRRGQEVVVQMTKEGIGTKGPTMTTYLSIPGRLLVMMPGMSRLGVSRKIEDEQARQQARQILQDLNLPNDIGFIVRTAGIDRPKRELQRDLNYLTRLWKSVNQRIKTAKPPAEIYQESDLVIRTLRDIYNTDIDRIICDRQDVAVKVKEFLDLAMPRTKHTVDLYTGHEGLFHDFLLENEIEKIFSRRVEMRSGGWLAIDQAEALVAIDVNSGRFRAHSDAETTALKINQEAAIDIARQLRLRDLGGVVIIDFIDMREEKNRKAVERTLRDALKGDRAKTKLTRISPFGILEMTRQRVRPSLRDSIYCRCPSCDGTGLIKSEESQALSVMRNIQRAASREDVVQIDVAVPPLVEGYLANCHRRELAEMEATSMKRITVKIDPTLHSDQGKIACTNSRGTPISLDLAAPSAGRKPPATVPIEQICPSKPIDEDDAEFDEVQEEFMETDIPLPQELEGQGELPEQVAQHDRGEQPVRPSAAPMTATSRPAGPQEPTATVEVPPQAQQQAVPQAPQQTGPAQAGAAGPAGAPAKRRRRGHRGGQRHRRKGAPQAAQQGVAAAGEPVGQPIAHAQDVAHAQEAARDQTPRQPAAHEDSAVGAMTEGPVSQHATAEAPPAVAEVVTARPPRERPQDSRAQPQRQGRHALPQRQGQQPPPQQQEQQAPPSEQDQQEQPQDHPQQAQQVSADQADHDQQPEQPQLGPDGQVIKKARRRGRRGGRKHRRKTPLAGEAATEPSPEQPELPPEQPDADIEL